MSVQARDAYGILHEVSGHANIDTVLSSTSKNPVSNKTIYSALAQKVDKAVTDLINYYTKSDVYNKAEVRELLGAINSLTIEVVATLPTSGISSTTIYFVGPTAQGFYDEYVYVNSGWVKIGDTEVDLSKYVTSDALTSILQSYYTSTEVDTILDDYYTKNEVDNELSYKQNNLTFDTAPALGSTNPVTSAGIKTALDLKQDILTFDNIPTDGSLKPVTSDGIYEAFVGSNTDLKDVVPASGSTKPITSGGVYSALANKQNLLTFDTTPTAGSTNPVTSAGIKSYIDGREGSLSLQQCHSADELAGFLVKTNLYYKSGYDFYVEFGHFSYGSTVPGKLLIQGYCYINGVIQPGALWIGGNASTAALQITMYEMSDGYVAFWIPKWSYWTGPLIQSGVCWPRHLTLTATNQNKPTSGYIRAIAVPTYKTGYVSI